MSAVPGDPSARELAPSPTQLHSAALVWVFVTSPRWAQAQGKPCTHAPPCKRTRRSRPQQAPPRPLPCSNTAPCHCPSAAVHSSDQHSRRARCVVAPSRQHGCNGTGCCSIRPPTASATIATPHHSPPSPSTATAAPTGSRSSTSHEGRRRRVFALSVEHVVRTCFLMGSERRAAHRASSSAAGT